VVLAAGVRLGPYEIVAPLGAGGMGEVWKARDTRLDRTVAIKVSKTEFTSRFEREARAIAALNHPHICQIYDVGPNYIVMEFIEGSALKGPMPMKRAAEYAGQILEALNAAHKSGLTHRDLKPANILVTRQGIKLLDFGLAKHHPLLNGSDSTVTEALTSEGQIAGTLQYMSPEQLQGREADSRSDIFAFGCVLYELLSGRRAFEGSSAASVIAAILEREPLPIDVAPPLDRVIQSCLAKDPDQRFQSAVDLKRALNWASDDQPAAPRRFAPAWFAIAVFAMGVAGGWVLSRLFTPAARGNAVRLQLTPPSGGRFGSFALSPDGRTLAFTAFTKGQSGLWLRPLEAMDAKLLPGTAEAQTPFWSPDGTSVAYFAANKLWRINLAGGPPVAICDAAEGRGGAWAADDTIVFAPVQSGLRRVSASGGASTELTRLDLQRGEDSHYWPQLLPGGRVLYWARGRPENNGMYVASLSKPHESRRVLATETNALYADDHLLWLRGSTLMAQPFEAEGVALRGEPYAVTHPVLGIGQVGLMFATASRGALAYLADEPVRQFTWLDQSGQAAGTFGESANYTSFELSADGRRVVASRESSSGADLWLIDAERNVSTRFTARPGISIFPIWSPDGQSIVFRSGNPWNLYRKDVTGGASEERITQSPNPQWPNDWSRDGRIMLYQEFTEATRLDLWVLSMKADGKPDPAVAPRLYLRTPFDERQAKFSPEPHPRWVAYVSDESGRYEVYVQSFPEPRRKWQISMGGGNNPRWGAGGQELFYVTPSGKLMSVKLKMGTDSLEPSGAREVFSIHDAYRVEPGGKRFLTLRGKESGSEPLQIILNWPALLNKRAPVE
jgi:Tol biopolymer transport system component/predicted Ser/Thr protein kinase